MAPLVKELSITILSFSVHLLHISDVLVVLLAAAVLACGHEEHKEQVLQVEKVDMYFFQEIVYLCYFCKVVYRDSLFSYASN